jgi:hypothetical protein
MSGHDTMNKRRAPRIAAAGLIGVATVLLAGAVGAAGTAVEQRPVSDVQRVVMRATGELIVRQGSSESLQIEAEASLLPKIATDVRDGTLYLEFRAPQVDSAQPLVFRLTVKRLEALDSVGSADVRIGALKSDALMLRLSGSGDIAVDALELGRLEAHLAGAGTITVGAGRVAEQTLYLTGAGDYSAAPLASQRATVHLDGSGNVSLHAIDRLVVRIAGSGDVRYRGTPRVEQLISGAGSVARIGGP